MRSARSVCSSGTCTTARRRRRTIRITDALRYDPVFMAMGSFTAIPVAERGPSVCPHSAGRSNPPDLDCFSRTRSEIPAARRMPSALPQRDPHPDPHPCKGEGERGDALPRAPSTPCPRGGHPHSPPLTGGRSGGGSTAIPPLPTRASGPAAREARKGCRGRNARVSGNDRRPHDRIGGLSWR